MLRLLTILALAGLTGCGTMQYGLDNALLSMCNQTGYQFPKDGKTDCDRARDRVYKSKNNE